jgi:hypothetical protein
MKGTGGLYLRGCTWWIRFSHRGQEFRESSESESETVARKLLKPASRKPAGAENFSVPPKRSLPSRTLPPRSHRTTPSTPSAARAGSRAP